MILRDWPWLATGYLVEEENESTLKLKNIGPDNRAYWKHFLRLNGFGVRDLCVQGKDLLILAGPTMNLDGPVPVFRWPGRAHPKDESLVFEKSLVKVIEIPFGHGEDHAKGMTLF